MPIPNRRNRIGLTGDGDAKSLYIANRVEGRLPVQQIKSKIIKAITASTTSATDVTFPHNIVNGMDKIAFVAVTLKDSNDSKVYPDTRDKVTNIYWDNKNIGFTYNLNSNYQIVAKMYIVYE